MSARNHWRYNVVAQILALKAHVLSPSCYRYLQALNCIPIIMTPLQNRKQRAQGYNILDNLEITQNWRNTFSFWC